MKNITTASFTMFLFYGTMHPAYAEDNLPDKFKIVLGGYTLVRSDTTMSLTEPNTGAGISIDPRDTLGIETEKTVARLEGYYRFNEQHALTYSWYAISSDGTKTLADEINWVDENGDNITIPIGASVKASMDYDIFKLGYLWSFYHNDKIELSAGAGLHVTRVAIGIDTATTSSGIDAKKVSTTVPLPVLSFGLTYHVTPKYSWYLKSEAFYLEFEDWTGSYTDSMLGMEYRVWERLGLGVALASNALKVTEDTSDYEFTYGNRISGAFMYAAAYF